MIRIDPMKCTGCQVCLQVCPQKVLVMENKKAQVADYTACMECGACRLNCTADAITLTKGTGCLAAIIKEDILKIAPKNTGCGCGEKTAGNGSGCC